MSRLVLCLLCAVHCSAICRDDDRLKPITDDIIGSRLFTAAKSKEHNWKMMSIINPDVKQVSELKKAYYINLPRNAYRRGRITQMMKSTAPDLPLEKFDAITKGEAKTADLTEMTTHGIADYMPKVYLGDSMWATVAVYLSHTRLLKKIMNENPGSNDMFLILEDDALPAAGDWTKKLSSLLQHIPEDWDMIRIGYGTDSNLRCQDKVNNFIFENREPTRSKDNSQGFYIGNIAYIVRPKSIPNILAQLRTMPVLDVDGLMMSREGGMRVYGVTEDTLWNHGNGIGFSDRMNPFSSLQLGSKAESSLADLIDKSAVETPTETDVAENAFDNFQEDTPDL